MPIIDFDTGTWADPWVQELSPLAKLLFHYVWTNDHINLPGLYPISIKTISNETGLTQKQVQDLLVILSPKVKYDPKKNVMWVVNYVKRQFLRTGHASPKITAGIRNALMRLPEGHVFIGEFLERYKVLGISYPYPMDTLSPTLNTLKDKDKDKDKDQDQDKEKKEGGVGEGKGEQEAVSVRPPGGNYFSPKDFASLYNQLCPSLIPSTRLSTKREEQIKLRLRDNPDIEWWKEVFVKANMVYIPPNKGHPNGWRPDLEFLVSNDDNAIKVFEGKYDQRGKGHKQYGAESLLKKVLQEEANEKAGQESIHSGAGEDRGGSRGLPNGSQN